MSEFTEVAKLSELVPGRAHKVELKGRAITLFNIGGQVHAIGDTCIHKGASLAEGQLEGKEISCPWHSWRFDVTTGACLNKPGRGVLCYRTEVEGDEVRLSLKAKLDV